MPVAISNCRKRITKVFHNFNSASIRLAASVYASVTAGMMAVNPVYCGTTMGTLFNKMVDIICTIAFYVGAIIIVGGIFNWILSQKDENADGQSRAIKFIVCGVALVALKTLVAPVLSSLTPPG